MIVVYAFHGIHPNFGHDKGIADVVGGAVAVLFGCAVLTGRVGNGRGQDAPAPRMHLEGHLSHKTAAVAGPATHLPGLFYLIALNVIVAHNPRVPRGAFAVITYNAVWYAVPIVAFAMCVLHPATALATVQAVDREARRHARTILLTVSFGAGTALIIRGALGL